MTVVVALFAFRRKTALIADLIYRTFRAGSVDDSNDLAGGVRRTEELRAVANRRCRAAALARIGFVCTNAATIWDGAMSKPRVAR